MKQAFYILTIVFACNHCHAQTELVDSLKEVINTTTSPQKKLANLFLLCEQKQSLPTDSLLVFTMAAKKIALQLGDKDALLRTDFFLAHCAAKNGLLDSALHMCNRNIPGIAGNEALHALYYDYLSFKASLLLKAERYKEALGQFYFLLNDAELKHDTAIQINAKNGIGWVNMEMDQNREALNWFFKALSVSPNPVFRKMYCLIYSNIAANYNTLHRNDSAEYFVNKSILLSRQYQNLTALANALNIQADIYIDTKRKPLAEAALTEAVAIRKKIGDPYYIVSDEMQLAKFYANNNETAKGINLCLEGISIAKKYHLSAKLMILYQSLAANYKAANNQEKYAATLQDIIALKDSVYAKNSAEALADIKGKYEMQKKENIIAKQKLDIVSGNYLLFGSLFFLVLGIIITILLFRNYRRKQRLGFSAMREEEQRLANLSVIEAEENERKRIAADLHDNMGAYATAIMANVDELVRAGEDKDSPLLDTLKSNAGEIMNNLRDTIWASNKERILLTGISDRFKNYVQKVLPAYPNSRVVFREKIERNIPLPPGTALPLFRIVQEGFMNALRNGRATLITVSFIGDDDLQVIITDNGEQLYAAGSSHINTAFSHLKERAALSGLHISVNKLNKGSNEIIITLYATTK